LTRKVVFYLDRVQVCLRGEKAQECEAERISAIAAE
jgi:hypothetical protein